jgi:transcriptional regulator GlxA family with amidase domain
VRVIADSPAAVEDALMRIAFLAFDDAQALDVFGPMEVFSAAGRIAGGEPYKTLLLTPDGQTARTSPASSSCSFAAPAARRSSPPRWPASAPSATRSATSSSG